MFITTTIPAQLHPSPVFSFLFSSPSLRTTAATREYMWIAITEYKSTIITTDNYNRVQEYNNNYR